MWWSVHCRSSECDPPGGNWQHEVAELVGCTPTELLDDPLRCLADYVEAETRYAGPPGSLPSLAELAAKQRRLWADESALAYLRTERCLTEQTIREYKVGLEPGALTFPVINRRGILVNLIRRRLPQVSGPRYIALKGRTTDNGGVQLYPNVPPGSWLLVEGVFDAILGRQENLPTVTSTHGVSAFLDEWLPLVKGRRVAVMYDVGAEQVTRHRVEQLRAAGAEAWAVDLSPLLGEAGKDLTDYVSLGGTRDELVAHISAESFVDSFKTELVADRVWRTRSQLELAIVEYIAWFNNSRLHENLDDRPPREIEELYAVKSRTPTATT